MDGLSTTLLIWGIACFVIGAVAFIFGVHYFKKGKQYHDMQKQLLIEAEKRVKLQYNKIATMTPNQLTIYLGGIFSRYLEINGEIGVTKDPLVQERLFANTQADVLAYLGDDTVKAIEYYYGDRYVEKWSNLAYLILEKRRKLGGIVDGSTGYETIEQALTKELSFKEEPEK